MPATQCPFRIQEVLRWLYGLLGLKNEKLLSPVSRKVVNLARHGPAST